MDINCYALISAKNWIFLKLPNMELSYIIFLFDNWGVIAILFFPPADPRSNRQL